MQPITLQSIPLEHLLIDLQNPRYDPRTSQREALATIAHDQGGKLLSLAEDIVDRGLNPSELAIVTPTEDENTYIVLEGNRRVAALKLISSPSLVTSLGLSQSLTKRYHALHERGQDTLPTEFNCVVLSREDANYWILLKHTGENEGIGVVMWDGRSRHRFRGSSPALQAIEMVEAANYLDDETKAKLPKIAITNIERVLNTPDARKHLGVDVKNNQLFLRSPEDEALGRLACIVTDVAHRQIRVTDLDSKEQRVSYAREVASRPLPIQLSGQSTNGRSRAGTTQSKTPKRYRPDRRTLVPRSLKLAIPQTRLNKIYHELQKVGVEHFVNSSAVLLRVFVELSVDDFAQRQKISFKTPVKSKKTSKPPRDMTLREKLKTVADYMEVNNVCSKQELRGIRALIANRDHVLSVDSLNAYVHNKDYNPTPTDLKANWDNIEIFMKRVWTI